MVRRTYPRLLRPGAGSMFLLGVRGVGKSTWAREAFPDAHVFDLLDERLHQRLLADPGLLGAEVAALPHGRVVVVDEVQRAPALLNEVHRAIERDGRRFVLLGSSARRLRTATTNLLAGRAVAHTMHPLVPAELGRDFDLDRALRYGTVPLVWRAPDPRATLEAYVHLYVREEVRGEALVRNLPAFLRFLPVAALLHGQVVNVSGLARDAQTTRATVDGHLGILQDTLLATLLPGYEARLRVRERRQPKLYWVDPGIARAARGDLGPVGAEERGPLLEGWVLMVLRAHQEVAQLYDEIAYWTPLAARDSEVDFLLRRGRRFVAIEVTSSPRVDAADLRGLRAIAELPGIARRVAVHLGERSLRLADGIEVWPIERFHREVAAGTLWPGRYGRM